MLIVYKKRKNAPLRIKGEIVSFETPDHITLHGFLSRPRRRTNKMVVHLHGLQGNFYASTGVKSLVNTFTKEGFNFLAMEQRGSYILNRAWKGKGKKARKILFGGALEKFEDCIYDIDGALEFARKEGMKKAYLEGHSTGCQKITYYQSKLHRRLVKGLILIAPTDDYNASKRDLGSKFNEAVDFARRQYKKDRKMMMPKKYHKGLTSVARFLSYSDLKNVEGRIFNYDSERLSVFGEVRVPVLAIFGTKEEYALKNVKDYLQILKDNSRTGMFSGVLIRGANHGFRKKEEELARAITRWLKLQST